MLWGFKQYKHLEWNSFHLLSGAKELSIELEGIKLEPEKLSKYRLIWNLKQFLFTGGYSGFQYSDFSMSLLKQAKIKKEKALIISLTLYCQMFIIQKILMWYFIRRNN